MIDFKNHDTLLPWCFWNKTDVGYDSFHVSATLQLSQSSCVCKDLHVFYWYLPLMERHTNWLRHVLNLRSENHWLSCLQNMGLGVGSSLMTTSSSEDKEFRQLIMNTSRTLSVHGYNVLTGVLNIIGNIKTVDVSVYLCGFTQTCAVILANVPVTRTKCKDFICLSNTLSFVKHAILTLFFCCCS